MLSGKLRLLSVWTVFFILLSLGISAAEYGQHRYCADSEGGVNTVKADIAGNIQLSTNSTPVAGTIERFDDYC